MKSKPGYKTTEFWLTMLAQAISLAMLAIGAFKPDSQVLVYLGTAMSLLSGLGYGAARASVKNGEASVASSEAYAAAELMKGVEDPFSRL